MKYLSLLPPLLVIGVASQIWWSVNIQLSAYYSDCTACEGAFPLSTTSPTSRLTAIESGTSSTSDLDFYGEIPLRFLREIAPIMNQSEWHNKSEEIIRIASKYIIEEGQKRTLGRTKAPPLQIDCEDPRYNSTLSGISSQLPKFIIDMSPFGFDLDYLEIRLLELYDVVDLFLITEQDRTQKGIPKPFILQQLLDSPRLRPYRDKIEYLPYHVPDSMIPSDPNNHRNESNWQIENAMRNVPLEYLKHTLLANKTKEEKKRIYIVQNDGDEIMNRHALASFKSCKEKKQGKYPIMAPAFHFKRNTARFELTRDLANLRIADVDKYGNLRRVLSRASCSIMSWNWLGEGPGGIRPNAAKNDVRVFSPHLGLGSSNHFSSPGNLMLTLLKMMGTIEEALGKEFTPRFWDGIAREREIASPRDIDIEFWPFRGDQEFVLMSNFTQAEQDYVDASLPWAIKETPYQYPWLYSDGILGRETVYDSIMRKRLQRINVTRTSL